MDKSSLLIWGGVGLAVIIGLGQEPRQSWKMRPTGNPDTVFFTVHRYHPGNSWTSSFDAPLARFRDLPANVLEHGGRAQFEYVAEAGKLVCKGSFSWNSGAGGFEFVPSSTFSSDLRELGYDSPSQDQLFDFMMSGVSLSFARAVRDAGVHATTAQLLDLRHRGVSLDFVRELRTYGYELSARDVMDLSGHGVSIDYLRDLRELGMRPRVSDIVEFRRHGIPVEYLSDLRAAGYDRLSTQQVIELRNHGVSAEFAMQARELGYRFTPQELVELRQHGVNGEYLSTLKASGMRPLTAGQITTLRQHGVD
jgi:hypothetical protein